MRIVFTILWVVTFSGLLTAAGPDLRLDSAAVAYNNGDYGQAVKLYESILEEGKFSAELYYNLGNACFNARDLACARLSYERALRLNPRDEMIREDLGSLKKELPDQFAEVAPFAPLVWWRSLASLLPVDGWSVLLVLSVWLFSALVWLRWKGRWKWSGKRWWQSVAMAGLIFFLSILLLLTRLKMLNDHPAAVIIQNEVVLKSAPDAFGTEMLTLHPGTKIFILDQIGGQLKVELPNGDTGWLPEDALERI